MKLLPAALLALLSAASSILPSATINESSSGVARKLNSKAEKSDENDDLRSRRDRIARRLKLYGVAHQAMILFDDDDNDVVNDAEKATLLAVLELEENSLTGAIPDLLLPSDLFAPLWVIYKDADPVEVDDLVGALAVGQDLEYHAILADQGRTIAGFN